MSVTTYREQGQSQASAEALHEWSRATERTSDASWDVARLTRELREAKKALKAAVLAEAEALRAYESTPYAD